MPRGILFAWALLLCACAAPAAGAQPAWTTAGPYVDKAPFSFEVPLEVVATKLFLEVEIGGAPRRFVFDTGSPSMMSAALAKELGLEVIDKIKGRDSHGAIVESRIVQSDLTLGGTTLRKLPFFTTDFPKAAQCLFDGVLGSDVLPLCAWQIDLPGSVLRCNSELGKLGHLERAKKQRLYDFGYPHAPILDVQFAADAKSKAMFDTGSPEYLAISPADFEGARRNGAIAKTVPGHGSLGTSIGGPAPMKDQLRVQLKELSLGNLALGEIDAPVRESSPSLLGASLLEHFVVTLDTRSGAAYFSPYRPGPYRRASYGFSLGFEDDVFVSLVWDGSPARAAGLRAGQRLSAINSEPARPSCDGMRHALRAMSEGNRIALEWDGKARTLTRQDWMRDAARR